MCSGFHVVVQVLICSPWLPSEIKAQLGSCSFPLIPDGASHQVFSYALTILMAKVTVRVKVWSLPSYELNLKTHPQQRIKYHFYLLHLAPGSPFLPISPVFPFRYTHTQVWNKEWVKRRLRALKHEESVSHHPEERNAIYIHASDEAMTFCQLLWRY